MLCKDRTYLSFTILILCSVIVISAGDFTAQRQFGPKLNKTKIIWCTISRAEQQKCLNFAAATERDNIRVYGDTILIDCKQAFNKDECMALLDEEKATMTTLDAGAIFIGGRYHSLVPIAQEVLEGGFRHYFAVAVIKKGTLSDVRSLHDLRNKKACFAGVETYAGWVLPINTLMKEGGMDIIDCNNHVKTASAYFGPSCAVNCLTDKYNPIGDNSDKLCQLCIGKIPGGRCTDSDPYAGYEGAFRCLLETGDIAFLKHNTVTELVSGTDFTSLSPDSFELLCKDGSRRSVHDYLQCNWGQVPSDAIVTSSAVSFDQRMKFQKFLEKASEIYFKRNVTYDPYNGNREPELDQFGNPIPPNAPPSGDFENRNPQDFDQFGNRNPDFRNPPNPDFDQYGNRRFKRQNFGDFGNRDERNRFDNYDPNRDRNRVDQYGNRDPNDPYNPNRPNENYDDFARDPYTINRNRYGVNVDPYRTDLKYNKDTDPYSGTNFEDIYNRRNTSFYEVFSLFESTPRYGIHGNLLFQDAAKHIAPVPENLQTYSSFLGDALQTIMGVRDCPVNRMTLCVTSDAEKEKCVKMRTALKAQLLKPEMDCYKGHSQIHCMQAISAGTADVTVLDASDVYTAGLNFDLVPFISEVYNLDEPEYYVVAVAKESDPSTELTYLRQKYTCHGGINTAAGWVYPLAFLISNGWIRPYGCNSIRAAAEYFTKSCVPGALSTEYNTGVPYDNMCDLCHGASFRHCRRDASEDYYGHTGAFRCLVEGGGHVAFVKHTTVTENTGGKKREWWARDNLNDDYELLCPDGTRAEVNEYTKCNLGKVKANAIVARGGYGYNDTHINAYINLFMYAQTFYGRKTTDEFSFSMFNSNPPYSDLIFQDATTQLKVVEPSKRYYSSYLGSDFMRARRIVDCHAGSTSSQASLLTLLLSAIFALVVLRN